MPRSIYRLMYNNEYNDKETPEEAEIISIIIRQTYAEEKINDVYYRAVFGELVRKYTVAGSKTPPERKAKIVIAIARAIAENAIQNPVALPEEIPDEVVKKRNITYPKKYTFHKDVKKV